jgi:hypothetical protein
LGGWAENSDLALPEDDDDDDDDGGEIEKGCES